MTDLTDYHPSERIETPSHELVFYLLDEPYNYGPYYSFDCDFSGHVDLEKLTNVQRESWERAHDTTRYHPGRVRPVTWITRHPAYGTCVCGQVVILDDPLWNGCDCGRYYNLSGQSVLPPHSGPYETGEYLGDIYNSRDDDW